MTLFALCVSIWKFALTVELSVAGEETEEPLRAIGFAPPAEPREEE